MDRRTFIVTSAMAILAAPLAAGGQPAGTIRIGYLSPGSTVTHGPFFDAFRQGLRELGYVEGRDLAIESRWAEGKSDRLPSLAARAGRSEGGRHSGGRCGDPGGERSD